MDEDAGAIFTGTQDIRKQANQDLQALICNGLTAMPRELPSILLWNAKGMELFERMRQARPVEYYPSAKEQALLIRDVVDICAQIQGESLVIELGCGNIHKTTLVLTELEHQNKNITYYALDVSQDELQISLHKLKKTFSKSKHIACRGLLGTYDDAASWMSNLKQKHSQLTILWLGNSIGNFSAIDASNQLIKLARNIGHSRFQMLLGVDGSRDLSEIRRCYDPAGNAGQDFLLNGLDSANHALNQDCFHLSDWAVEGSWDSVKHVWKQYYIAKRRMLLNVQGRKVDIAENERIIAIRSAKWSKAEMDAIARLASLQVSKCWATEKNDYGLFLLAPLR